MARIVDRLGQKFGHLIVVALAPERDPRGHAVWICDCNACGSKGKRVRAGHLAVTNSCGCLKGNRIPKKRVPLTQERLKELLHYSPGNGPLKELDHINRDRSDNHITNLRESTRSENNANSKMQKNNRSGFKGAYQNGSGWMAKVKHNGKNIYLGTFDSPEEAHAAYCAKARELHGEFFCDGGRDE